MAKPVQNAVIQPKKRRTVWGKLLTWCLAIAVVALLEMLLIYPFCCWRTVYGVSGAPSAEMAIFSAFGNYLGQLHELPQWIRPPTGSLLLATWRGFCHIWWVNLLLLLLTVNNRYKRRPFGGMEHGSAEWAGTQEYKAFAPRPGAFPILHNLWIGEDNGLPNLHGCVLGGTGYGKTFTSLIPLLLADVGSYIVADVKGALYTVTRHLMKQRGYRIRVLNLKDARYSDRFNPFSYCRKDSDMAALATAFVLNSRTADGGSGDQFWEDSMRALFCSIGHYMLTEGDETATMPRMLEIVTELEVVNGRIAPQCFYARKMQQRELDNPFDPALVHYKIFESGAGETLQSILISMGVRLQLWVNKEIQMLMNEDDFDLRTVAASDQKTVIYLILPEKGDTMRPISAMFLQTVFEVFSDVAMNVVHGQLPQHWMFLFDEFANLGKFPDIVSYLTLVRAYGIRMYLYLQSLQQLRQLYKDQDKTILGNCAAFIYLGCNDPEVHKDLSERLDKATIRTDSSSHAVTGHGGDSESEQGTGRSLMTPGEIAARLQGRSIVILPDHNPFIGKKVQTQSMAGYDLLGREVNRQKQYAAYANNRFVEEDYQQAYAEHLAAFEQRQQALIAAHRQQQKQLREAMEVTAAGQKKHISGFTDFEETLGIAVLEDTEPETPEKATPSDEEQLYAAYFTCGQRDTESVPADIPVAEFSEREFIGSLKAQNRRRSE